LNSLRRADAFHARTFAQALEGGGNAQGKR
jgi:hypothetical protein